MNKSIILNIVWIVVAISLVAVFYVQSSAFLKLKAYNDCSMESRYEHTEQGNGVHTSQTITDLYKKCLKDKGY